MDQGALAALFEASAIGWIGALVGVLVGAFEWFVMPGWMETSIRSSREARKLNKAQLEGVVSWWKTVIRVIAVAMPVVGFGLATALAE